MIRFIFFAVFSVLVSTSSVACAAGDEEISTLMANKTTKGLSINLSAPSALEIPTSAPKSAVVGISKLHRFGIKTDKASVAVLLPENFFSAGAEVSEADGYKFTRLLLGVREILIVLEKQNVTLENVCFEQAVPLEEIAVVREFSATLPECSALYRLDIMNYLVRKALAEDIAQQYNAISPL